MKKIYTLLFIILSFAGVLKAQYSLTAAANEPVVGDAERRKGFDSTSALLNSSGANQNWNFTTLTSNTVPAVTSTFTTPSSVPGYTGSSVFAGSTVAKTDGTVSSFYKSTPTQFEFLGTVPSSSLSLSFTNTAISAIWPVTNTYSNSDPFSGSVKVVIFIPSTGPFSGTQNVNATGTGTLQLPNGITLNNCLQLTSNLNGTGSVNILTITATMTMNTTNYDYYHSSQKFPVLSISYSKTTIKLGATGTPTVTNTTQISVNNDIFSGINEYTLDNSLTIYPNPASDFITVGINNDDAIIEIVNQLGQTLKSEKINSPISQINISSLNSGIYFVKTTIGNKSSVKKLIKD